MIEVLRPNKVCGDDGISHKMRKDVSKSVSKPPCILMNRSFDEGFFLGGGGARWLSGRVLDSRLRGRGFEPHRHHCLVVLEQDTFVLA